MERRSWTEADLAYHVNILGCALGLVALVGKCPVNRVATGSGLNARPRRAILFSMGGSIVGAAAPWSGTRLFCRSDPYFSERG